MTVHTQQWLDMVYIIASQTYMALGPFWTSNIQKLQNSGVENNITK
jgi:hypothetical protein